MEFTIGAIALVASILTVFFAYGIRVCYVYRNDPSVVPSDRSVPWGIMAVLTVLCFCVSLRYWFLLASF